METQKPLLKDEDGKEVDVHMYRSMIGSLMYLTSSRPDIMFAVCACARYQVNPKVKTVNGKVQLQALVDGKKIIITESTVRRDLQLEDAKGVDCLPNATIFEQLALMGYEQKQKPRKPKRKDTQIPHSSGPTKHVADEAIYKELDDSLVRAATTASSLEAKQDSGGGPRCQETIGDTIAQTRVENVYKLSNDPLLVRGNILQSGEDSLKLKELMELCSDLQTRVLDLEKTKTTQAEEIGRRIHDIDVDEDITLVNNDNEIFDVDALAGEEVFIAEQSGNVVKEVVVVINVASTIPVSGATITDVEITLAQALAELKSAKPKADKCMVVDKDVKPMKRLEQMRLDEELAFKLQAKEEEEEEEKRLAREKAQQIKESNIAWDDVQAKVEADYQLDQRLQAHEQEELTDKEKARLFVQFLEQRRKHFAAKRAEEKRNRPPTRAQERNIMCTYLKNMEGWKPKKLGENLKKDEVEVMEGSSKRAGEELEQESIKKQKVDEDKETAELQSLIEVIPDEEDVAIDVVPLATKPPTIVDWKIYKEGKKSYYQIIRADGKS
ncbi:hypothetical protein Tco_0665810 [Tanacetum coccineum]